MNTKLQVIAVKDTVRREINVCSLNNSPDNDSDIDKSEVNNFITQLPKPFIILRGINSYNTIKQTDQKGRIFEEVINSNNLYIFNNESQTYLNPSTGDYSTIDVTMYNPLIRLDYTWKVHHDTRNSYHFPIILCRIKMVPSLEIKRTRLQKISNRM